MTSKPCIFDYTFQTRYILGIKKDSPQKSLTTSSTHIADGRIVTVSYTVAFVS